MDIHTKLPDQIRAQAGSDTVHVHVVVMGCPRRVALTRQQADQIIAGGCLTVDPITGCPTVSA